MRQLSQPGRAVAAIHSELLQLRHPAQIRCVLTHPNGQHLLLHIERPKSQCQCTVTIIRTINTRIDTALLPIPAIHDPWMKSIDGFHINGGNDVHMGFTHLRIDDPEAINTGDFSCNLKSS